MSAPRTLASNAALTGLAAAVVLLPVLRGGVDWPTQAAAAALLLAAWALVSFGSSGWTLGTIVLSATVGWIVLQLIPLPTWAHGISPAARRTFELALGPIGGYPEARPLSLDPPETARALLHAFAVLAAFSCASFFSETRVRRRLLVSAIALSGTTAGLAGLGAALLGMGPLLGVHFPFVNPNHLASACGLSALVALGLAVRSAGGKRASWVLAFVVCGATVALSLSRAGILALVLGCGVFAALSWRGAAGGEPGVRRHRTLVGLAFTALVLAAGFVASAPVLAELRTLRHAASEPRAELLSMGLRVARDFPVVGVGRGAFVTVFPGYKSEPLPVTFTHVENTWLQALVDLGWPIGLLLLGTFAWIWARAARSRDLSATEVGLLAGTAAVALHDLADFSLELTGIAVPFAAALGVLGRERRTYRLPRPALAAAFASMFLLAAFALVIHRSHPTLEGHRPIADAADARAADAAARRVAAWHPADYLVHASAASRWIAEGRCAEGLPWLRRAMMLNPTAAEPHRAAAVCLLRRGDRSLARQELRLAFAFGDPGALAAALDVFPALEDLLEIVPDTPDALYALGLALAAERPAEGAAVFGRLLATFADERAELPLARLLLTLGDARGALEVSSRRARAAHADAEAHRLAAEALEQLGRSAESLQRLETGLAAFPGSPQLLSALADRAHAARRFAEELRLTEQMLVRTPTELAEREMRAGRALLALTRHDEAIERYRSAAAARPDWPAPLERLAAACAEARRYDDAIAALEAARAAAPDRAAAYERDLSRLRAEQGAAERERERRRFFAPAPSTREAEEAEPHGADEGADRP